MPPSIFVSQFVTQALTAAVDACRSQDMELQLWLMKHLCEKCGGTLTPIDGYTANSTDPDVQSPQHGVADGEKAVHVCNSCGARRPDRVFDMIVQAEMAAAGVDEDTDGDEEGQQEQQGYEDDSGHEYDDLD